MVNKTSDLIVDESAKPITATIDGVVTSNYITKSGVYEGSIIDEIINIDVTLADSFSLTSIKRQFAFFGEVVGGGDYISLTRADINNYFTNLLDDKTKEILTIWFNNGGTKITIININSLIESRIVKFDAKNLILAGLWSEDQLKAYELYKIEGKRIFLTKKKIDNYDVVAKNRETAIFLVSDSGSRDADYPVFEYYAKYAEKYAYRSNNFERSKLYNGLLIDSITYLKSNKIGALMVIGDNNPSIYYNMVDTSGADINLSFLKDDLVDDIQYNILNVLAADPSYNQPTINRIDLAIKNVALFFMDGANFSNNRPKIQAFSQTLIPFKKQSKEDINNKIMRGFVLKYLAITEVNEVKINLVEKIGSLD